MFEATFTIAAQVESGGQGQHAFRVREQADPLDDAGFFSLVETIYEQGVSPILRAGDDLRAYFHLDLPPREIDKRLHVRQDGPLEGEGMAEPVRDLHPLIASMVEYYRPHVQAGDVLTISFQVKRI